LLLKVRGGLNKPGGHLWIGSRLRHFEQCGGGLPRMEAILGHGYSSRRFLLHKQRTLNPFLRERTKVYKAKRGWVAILPIAHHGSGLPIPIEIRPHVGTPLAGRYCESSLSCSSNLLAFCSATACSTRSGRNRRPGRSSVACPGSGLHSFRSRGRLRV